MQKKSFECGIKLPQARVKEIVVQNFEDETLVYDLMTDKAHYLNKTISLVWQNCDGNTTTGKLADLLEKELNVKIETDFIWLALAELEKAKLLKEKVKREDFTNLSRRKVLFRYAPLAVALPVVMSLIAPQAVHAQSCLATGQTGCNFGQQCCDVGDFCAEDTCNRAV